MGDDGGWWVAIKRQETFPWAFVCSNCPYCWMSLWCCYGNCHQWWWTCWWGPSPLIKLLLLFGGINLHPIKFKKLYLQDLELPAPLVKYLEVGGLFLRSSGAAPMVHCAHVCMVWFDPSDPFNTGFFYIPVQVCKIGLPTGVVKPSPTRVTATQQHNWKLQTADSLPCVVAILPTGWLAGCLYGCI